MIKAWSLGNCPGVEGILPGEWPGWPLRSFPILTFVYSLVPTSTLGLRSTSDSLCDSAKPLSLSGSQFPHLHSGGLSLLRASRILSRSSLENRGYGKTAQRMALCCERSQPGSCVWTPTLCAVSSGCCLTPAGSRSGSSSFYSKVEMTQIWKVLNRKRL